MSQSIKKYLPEIILTLFVVVYAVYFSLFTINRFDKLYAHYFDLGIMHHTVYNSYKAIQTGDLSRFLELTNPHQGTEQVTRMAIHNDMLLGLLAPFYFIHDGPETLLIIQSLVLAMGGVFVYLIANHVLKSLPYTRWLALTFSISYLLYPPIHKANRYEFHAVVLATTFLLAMYYFWLKKKYVTSFMFALLSILSKEQVGMTTAFFGGFIFLEKYKKNHVSFPSWKSIRSWYQSGIKTFRKSKNIRFAVILIATSVIWVALSLFVIIPLARGGEHFASKYYHHIEERPWRVFTYSFKQTTWDFLWHLLGPVGFLSLLSPLHLFISLPEFGVILLSNNPNMRNTYFHYESVITPFVFIAAIYGVRHLVEPRTWNVELNTFVTNNKKRVTQVIIIFVLVISGYFSYKHSFLPYSVEKDMYPWRPYPEKYEDVLYWKSRLDEDQLPVSSTGQLSPHFASRQYFYEFGWKYEKAAYIVIDTHDVQYGFLNENSYPLYEKLQNDKNYSKIYDRNGIEVYEKK